MKPGEEMINEGIADLREGRETIPALLVMIGAPRLRRLGAAHSGSVYFFPGTLPLQEAE